jgi:hypothetical protein
VRLVAVVTAMLVASCFVDRKSDSIKCTTSTDCTESDHVCDTGYCVKASQTDCPAHCSACDTTVTPHTCTVNGTGGNAFDCPSGYACSVTCSAGSKCGDITCESDSKCVISCEGGGNSCANITCDQACACDVTCTTSACQNNTISCPQDGTTYCTPTQTDGPACTSAPGGRCNSC